MIAERTTEEKQRRQGQQKGVHHPLHVLSGGSVTRPDRRQCDVEDRAVDERQARGEDAGDQRPARVRLGLIPPAAVAWAQSTFCAMAASTMLRHIAVSPTAAIASSGSRAV